MPLRVLLPHGTPKGEWLTARAEVAHPAMFVRCRQGMYSCARMYVEAKK
jgi:hypothetical protein